MSQAVAGSEGRKQARIRLDQPSDIYPQEGKAVCTSGTQGRLRENPFELAPVRPEQPREKANPFKFKLYKTTTHANQSAQLLSMDGAW